MTHNKKEVFDLDFYETEEGIRWNWKKGLFASQEFESERAAIDALSSGRVKFSTLDDEDILGALQTSAEFNNNLLPPFDYWLVDELSVFEPRIFGRLLGKLPEFMIAPGMKALKMSAEDFQTMREAAIKQQEALVDKVQAYSQRAKRLGISADELQAAGAVVGQFGLHDDVVDFILEDDKGPLITKYLSQNLAELDKLISMSTTDAAVRIATTIKADATAFKPKPTNDPEMYTQERRLEEVEQCTEAVQALHEEKYEIAKDLFQKLAEEGNLVAKIDLARLHLRELIKSPDFNLARILLEEASAASVSGATVELGNVYRLGRGAAIDLKHAFELYHLAAKQGDPEGMYRTGHCYRLGVGVERNLASAIIWFGKAAHADHELACYDMGQIYLNGEIEKDPAMAANFYERGATLGNSYCQNKLGLLYRDGVGREKNLKEAFHLFQLSAQTNNEWGQYLLGCMYLQGSHVEQDIEAARELLELSAEQGLPDALVELGAIYGKGLGVSKDRAKSIDLYKAAAEKNNALASYNLGIIYLNGDGVEQDISKGIHYMSQAAQLGMEDAENALLELKNTHGIETPETKALH
jgi:TPR repeat protein